MSGAEPPTWLFLLPFAWIAGCVGASILYRRAAGKPVIPHLPPATRFRERGASGWNDSHWLGQLGGANGCLLVAVTDRELIVTPFFPFNLMFLPEILGLEARAPLTRIRAIEDKRRFFRRSLVVDLGDGQRIGLILRNPGGFLAAARPGT